MRVDDLFPYTQPKKSSSSEEDDDLVPAPNIAQVEGGERSSIKYYTLLHLNSERMQVFAKARGLESASTLVSEIERLGMKDLAGRPKDLDDLILFWRDHGRLGSRRKIVEENVKRKLLEDDLDRAEKDLLSPHQALAGAKNLAAAVALTHCSKIIAPDGSSSGEGISVQSVLAGWSPKECYALLGRPTFDAASHDRVSQWIPGGDRGALGC